MGGETSACDSSAISNINARKLFESVNQRLIGIDEKEKKGKNLDKLVKFIFESLKNISPTAIECSFVISGAGFGDSFLNFFAFDIDFPETLTKVSLRKSRLNESHAMSVARFLIKMKHIKQFEVSENKFGKNAKFIFRAATGHPSLILLQLEECDLQEDVAEDIENLIKYSQKLETLRLSPISLSPESRKTLTAASLKNRHLTNLDICQNLEKTTTLVSNRNSFIYEFVDSIARSPFQRQFRTKIDAFKSVKGREMLMGKAKQKEKVRGTNLFDRMEEADQNAKNTEVKEDVEKVGSIRSGHAEMIGRRPNMEDVTIILPNTPTQASSFFGLFDGHGGREAAEFASEHLPEMLKECLNKGGDVKKCYEDAFKRIQSDMRPWCVYVGCTACISVIEGSTLTVANIGDTRCVLFRDGEAKRLTVDHKPDLPEETAFIQDRGGFVRDGRVGGMLAVSRAFGDGFLGESINSVPHFVQETITSNDKFLIMACDGVWDVITDQEACDIVASEIDPLEAAKKLRDAAFERESTDNISVIVIPLAGLFVNDI